MKADEIETAGRREFAALRDSLRRGGLAPTHIDFDETAYVAGWKAAFRFMRVTTQ